MKIYILEFLTFGLGNLLKSHVEGMKLEFVLLTSNRDMYSYELEAVNSNNLEIIDIDTFDVDLLYKTIIDHAQGDQYRILSITDTLFKTSLKLHKKLNIQIKNLPAIDLVRNKSKLRNTLFDNGYSSYKSYIITDKNTTIDIDISSNNKFIAKDNSGTGSQNISIIDTNQKLHDLINNTDFSTLKGDGFILEPYINGTLYSAEYISYQGKHKLLAITSRIMSSEPLFKEIIAALPVQLPANKLTLIKDKIEHILNSINYSDSFSHIEFFLTNDELEIVEINPRIGGGLIGNSLCEIYNINVYQSMIDIILDIQPRLLNENLVANNAISFLLVYADTVGIFQGISNLNNSLKGYKDFEVIELTKKGTRIEHIQDQRSNVAIIKMKNDNSELSTLDLLSISNKLKVTTE